MESLKYQDKPFRNARLFCPIYPCGVESLRGCSKCLKSIKNFRAGDNAENSRF